MFQIFQFSVRNIFMKRYIVSCIYFYLHLHNFVFCQYGSQPIVVRVCNVWILNKKSLKLYCPRSQPVQLHHVKSGTQIIERILYIIFCFWEQFYITLRPPWGQDIEIVRTLNVESGRIKCRGQCKVSLLDRLSTFIQNFYQFQGKAEEQSSDEMRYLYKKPGGKG